MVPYDNDIILEWVHDPTYGVRYVETYGMHRIKCLNKNVGLVIENLFVARVTQGCGFH